MKPIIVSTADIKGGAGKAAVRLHKGLRENGVDSRMLVKHRLGRDPGVIQVAGKRAGKYYSKQEEFFIQDAVERLHLGRRNGVESAGMFSFSYPGYNLAEASQLAQGSVVNFHWIAEYVSPWVIGRILESGKPCVWTLHDMWPFTGGCHYTAGCERFATDCYPCPQLGRDPFGIARAVLRDKQHYLGGGTVAVVSPSRWLAEEAARSALFRDSRIEVIPNGIEDDYFQYRERAASKKALGIDGDTLTLMFGAVDGRSHRKGFDLLSAALEVLSRDPRIAKLKQEDRICIINVGTPSKELQALDWPVRELGYIKGDADLAGAYSAADIFVLPSREENFPNTMLEAMACGAVVVAFDIGGIGEVVRHQQTGLLVKPFDNREMAAALIELISRQDLRDSLAAAGREAVKGFTLVAQGERYAQLFEEVTADADGQAGAEAGSETSAQRVVVPISTASGFASDAESADSMLRLAQHSYFRMAQNKKGVSARSCLRAVLRAVHRRLQRIPGEAALARWLKRRLTS